MKNTDTPSRISLAEWDARYAALRAGGLREGPYGGPLGRHTEAGDSRLLHLRFDNSPAALRLWNFFLTEEGRLAEARAQGCKLVGAMKDLGTVPVIAGAFPNVAAFYPDGAWWIPCIMEGNTRLLEIASSLGLDESFCPVRAMVGAFVTGAHFPVPDLLICSAGATCDDFSAVAQRLEALGHPIHWWEIPYRRVPEAGEEAVPLPGGGSAPRSLVRLVRQELEGIAKALEDLAGVALHESALRGVIRETNRFRRILDALRHAAYASPMAPLPALEMLIAEMFAIHFCSDALEARGVLEDLLEEARRRIRQGQSPLEPDAVRVFWVNPVADLRAMNLLEDCGGRICGTEYLFTHALDPIPEDLPPFEALARAALSDPMAGSASDRAARICRDAARFGAEAVVISRIPGASHCATEGLFIADAVIRNLGLPVQSIEIPSISDTLEATVRTRLEALLEIARARKIAAPKSAQGGGAGGMCSVAGEP